MGFLSDELTGRFGDGALRVSVIACLAFYLLAAALMAFAIKSLRQDWVHDDPPRRWNGPLTGASALATW